MGSIEKIVKKLQRYQDKLEEIDQESDSSDSTEDAETFLSAVTARQELEEQIAELKAKLQKKLQSLQFELQSLQVGFSLTIAKEGLQRSIVPPAFAPVWQFDADNDDFASMSPEINGVLTNGFKEWKLSGGSSKVSFNFAGIDYEVDFDDMTQTRSDTGKVRDIKYSFLCEVPSEWKQNDEHLMKLLTSTKGYKIQHCMLKQSKTFDLFRKGDARFYIPRRRNNQWRYLPKVLWRLFGPFERDRKSCVVAGIRQLSFKVISRR